MAVPPGSFMTRGQPLRLLVQIPTDDTQQLDRVVRRGHVMIAASRHRLLLILRHGEATDGDDRDRCKTGQRLDLPCGVIAVEHGQLEVHEHEVGVL
jgi:hypothetical protein